jgi:hypothetical protein
MRSPSEGSAAVDAILWLVCAPTGLKKRNIFNQGLAAPLSTQCGIAVEIPASAVELGSSQSRLQF